MKRMLCILICLLMISVNPASSESSEKADTVYKSGDYTYTLDNSGAIITAYSGMDSALEVPSSIDGHTVKGIGDHAFESYENLTSITLPEGLETIGNNAFTCTSLTSVALPDGLKSIGDLAFDGCMRLTSITLPKELESIGNWTFYACQSLTSIDLPEGLKFIGDGAFSSCSNLVSVTIPDSVEIMEKSFYNCESLEEILVSSENPLYSQIDGVLFNKAETKLLSYPAGKKGSSYIVPAGVKSIGYRAFSSCENLITITFPEGLKAIDTYAFQGCRKLFTVTLPDSVEKIDGNPFNDCENLAEILVAPDNPIFTQIDGVLFNKAETILLLYPTRKRSGEYIIPAGVKSIGDSAFSNCVFITSITLPEGLESIGECAFISCPNLTSIVLPEGLDSIGDYAFISCHSLTSIVLSEGLESIGMYAFYDCDRLTSITLSASIMSIGIDAFNKDIILTVTRDSYAEKWAKESGIQYQYPDSAD